MELVDMKMELQSKDDSYEAKEMMMVDKPKYPYGLKLCLEKEELDKLGISEMPEIGANMKMMAVVQVCSLEAKDYEGEEYRSMGLQVKEMALMPEVEAQSAESMIYGEA